MFYFQFLPHLVCRGGPAVEQEAAVWRQQVGGGAHAGVWPQSVPHESTTDARAGQG